MSLRKVTVEEIERDELPKGCLIMVRWLDASDRRAPLSDHVASPEVTCKDWGIYLGCSGQGKKMLILGKDVVEVYNEWGATRIPVDLIDEVVVILPREEVVKAVREVQVLGRRVSLRRYVRSEERVRVVVA
jgi:hypothetical protein